MNTKTNSIYRSFFIVAALSAVAYLFFTARGQHSTAGWLLVLFFLFLAIGFRSVKVLRGFSYTVCIIGAVCMAMYYPQYFSTIGDFKLSKLTIPLLQIIMFGMGTELSLKDFGQVMKAPKQVIAGLICHFTIMPFLGLGIAMAFNFPGEIAAGIILIGCSPSGLASNVMSYLAKANLALSVCITALSTLLAPFLTPLLMKLLGGPYIQLDF